MVYAPFGLKYLQNRPFPIYFYSHLGLLKFSCSSILCLKASLDGFTTILQIFEIFMERVKKVNFQKWSIFTKYGHK